MGNSDSKQAASGEENANVTGDAKAPSPTKEENGSRNSPDRSSKSRRSRARNGKPNSEFSKSRHQREQSNEDQKITDDQIQVNLAMADLMAYLQVVANNSNHLPITRRDDPEVEKTVSVLSSDEYAKKSAAFLPADIRVIGGAFSRYGRVWDLPTSEVRIYTMHARVVRHRLVCSLVSSRTFLCRNTTPRTEQSSLDALMEALVATHS